MTSQKTITQRYQDAFLALPSFHSLITWRYTALNRSFYIILCLISFTAFTTSSENEELSLNRSSQLLFQSTIGWFLEDLPKIVNGEVRLVTPRYFKGLLTCERDGDIGSRPLEGKDEPLALYDVVSRAPSLYFPQLTRGQLETTS